MIAIFRAQKLRRLAPIAAPQFLGKNYWLALLVLGLLNSLPLSANENQWRSTLYPDNWTPGYSDSQGRFLHDFSYAGYHRGEIPIPETPPGNIFDVTSSAFGADSSGQLDATNAIQLAINAASNAGGGIVFLPAGTYRIATPPIVVDHSNIVLRGAGQNETKLYIDKENMRDSNAVSIGHDVNGWANPKVGTELTIAEDIAPESLTFKVSEWPTPFPYEIGDEIIIGHDITDAFVDDHDMRRFWIDIAELTTGVEKAWPRYHRTVVELDPTSNEITVDIPIRYIMKTRDNLRVYISDIEPIREVGVESLSIGMKQHPAVNNVLPSNTSVSNPNGTAFERAAYDLHASNMMEFKGVINGWIRNFSTYRPADNNANIHIHSRGIELSTTRNITIENTTIERPQSRTGGGNGYLYFYQGAQETLVANSTAVAGRHNFQISLFQSSGNVFHKFTSIDGLFPSDTHKWLSPAQLVDDSVFSGKSGQRWGIGFQARGQASGGAGHTSTQSVIWNVVGNSNYIITNALHSEPRPFDSNQFGEGYIIGTSGTFVNSFGTCPMVSTDLDFNNPDFAPCRNRNDFIEGIGAGATLLPQSLYLDQKARRLNGSTNISTGNFIDTGSQWRYLDDGSDQGTAWSDTGFNDSAWSLGTAQLGFGDGDEATTISFGPDASNKHITTYFRHSFNVQDASSVTDLTLNLLRDDGAVAYLNGTEVVRSNMPSGAITYTTLAPTGTAGIDESTFISQTISPSLLVDGTNVIAVEVHQNGPTSSDLSFDLQLGFTAVDNTNSGNVAPVITDPSDQISIEGESINFTIVATDADGDSLTYSASSLPPQLSIDSGTGQITGTVTTAGSYTVNVMVDDNNGGTDSAAFDWVVNLSTQSDRVLIDSVTASTDDGNVPANTLDGNLSTRWSAQGDGQYIQYDIGSTQVLSAVSIAWFNGDQRTANFDVQLSIDGNNWVDVLTNQVSSGLTLELERYDFPPMSARHLRIIGHGNNQSNWNSITEVEIYRVLTQQPTAGNFIDTGSQWRYLDDGSDQGTAWSDTGFNDSAWSLGTAQLGFGDGDEATTISFGPDASNKHITTYFRHSFNVQDASSVTDLTLNLLRDDGAVAYLNGTEVVRSNMPSGAITYTTLAPTGTAGIDESTFISQTISPSLLVDGTNVIAVEVHQNGPTSSDLSFDLQLGFTGI